MEQADYIRILRLGITYNNGQKISGGYLDLPWDRGYLAYPVNQQVAKDLAIRTGAFVLTLEEAVAESLPLATDEDGVVDPERLIAPLRFLKSAYDRVSHVFGDTTVADQGDLISDLRDDKREQGKEIAKLKKKLKSSEQKVGILEKRLASKAVQAEPEEELETVES